MDFFKEFEDLKSRTPRIGSIIINSTNCTYNHNIDRCKNCYLIANGVKNEDCMYGRDFYENTDCVDCDHILRCTLCYECVNSKECYDSSYLQDCNNCVNCDFGYDLKDCKNCIGCAGLRKKEFYIFNEPCSKENFSAKKKEMIQNDIKQNFEGVKLKTPRRFAWQIQSENCLGNYIFHSQNIYQGFDAVESQDCAYCAEIQKLKDCVDISMLEYSELCCEISSCYKLHNCNFCFGCVNSSNLDFCELVMNSKNCFGCVGLNHKEYHVLNKSYSREDYYKKIAEIKNVLKQEKDYGAEFWKSTYPHEDTMASWPRL